VPLVTLYKPTLEVDVEATAALAERLSRRGLGILVAGTTGEMPLLELNEKLSLASAVRERVGARVPVWLGVGGPNPRHVAGEASLVSSAAVVDAILVPPPYYYPLRPGDVEAYYLWLSKVAAAPIIAYIIPSHTGIIVPPDSIARIAHEAENVVGVKATVDSAEYQASLIHAARSARPDFLVYAGYDHLLAYNLAHGGSGGVVAGANVCPRLFKAIAEAETIGELVGLHETLHELRSVLSQGNTVIGAIKVVLEHEGLAPSSATRPPITPENEETRRRIIGAWTASKLSRKCL